MNIENLNVPKCAGIPRTREEISESIIIAARDAGGIDEPLPGWLLDWAEKREAERVNFMWWWHNAITAMQCAIIENRNNLDDDDNPGWSWIINHLAQPGALPPDGQRPEVWWKNTAVPFDALAEAHRARKGV